MSNQQHFLNENDAPEPSQWRNSQTLTSSSIPPQPIEHQPNVIQREGSIPAQNTASLGVHPATGTLEQRGVPCAISRTGDLHGSGQEPNTLIVVRQLSKIRKDVCFLTDKLTQILDILKEQHFERTQQCEKTMEILRSFLGNEVTENKSFSDTKLASLYLSALIFLEFLNPASTDLFHIGPNTSDRLLHQAVRFVLGSSSTNAQVRAFLERKIKGDGSTGSARPAASRMLLRQRTRVYNTVRQEVVKCFRVHCPSSTGLNISESDEDLLRENCRKYTDNESLLYGADFHVAWNKCCQVAFQVCTRKLKSVVSQICKETGSDATKLDISIASEPMTNTYSAALLAFVRVKVCQAIAKFAGDTQAGELQGGHSEMWAKSFIGICESVRKLELMGHQRILSGVVLRPNPSAEALNRISSLLEGNGAGISTTPNGDLERMDEQ